MHRLQKRTEVFSSNNRHSNWHGRPPSELAGSMVVYTLPDEMIPDNLALGSLVQERYFEAIVRDEAIRYQKEVLEPDPRYQKPGALPSVAESTPFVGVEKFETFEEWLAKQPREFEEDIEDDVAA